MVLESWLFPFPQCRHSCKGCRSLKGMLGKINGIHFGSILGSFLKGDPTSSSFRELWICELVQIWRLIGESWLSVLMIPVRFLFTWTRALPLIQIKSDIIRLPICFTFLGIPWLTTQSHRSAKDSPDWYFDSAVHLGNHALLLLVVECLYLASATLGWFSLPLGFPIQWQQFLL